MTFFSFPYCPPEGMPTNSTSQEVVLMSGKIFLLVELLMYGTVYLILFVLLVLLFLRNVL